MQSFEGLFGRSQPREPKSMVFGRKAGLRLCLTAFMVSAAAVGPSESAMGGPFSYRCTIENYFVANQPGKREWVAQQAMKSEVIVDRRTGRVFHPAIGNEYFENVIVLDKGSSEWSFKSLAFVQSEQTGGSFVRYIEVYEFEEGEVKRFMAVAEGITYSGVCI